MSDPTTTNTPTPRTVLKELFSTQSAISMDRGKYSAHAKRHLEEAIRQLMMMAVGKTEGKMRIKKVENRIVVAITGTWDFNQ